MLSIERGDIVRHSFVIALLALAALTPNANAAPSNTKITAVYLTSKCGGGTCTADDPKLANGALVIGSIQVDVASSDTVGFSSVRLEARAPGDPIYNCVHLWFPGGTTQFTGSALWATKNWPSPGPSNGCNEEFDHKHGEPAVNGSYSMHVVAVEAGSQTQQISSEFVIRLANPADPPLWRGNPTADKDAVTLRWYRNVEPDVIEYRITRTDSKGTKVIALNASSPTSTTGCLPEQEASFTCTDHPASGTVRYSIQAFRPTPTSAPNCKTKSTPCVGSPPNAKKTVTVAGSTQPTTPLATTSPKPGTSASLSATPTQQHGVPGPTSSAPGSPQAGPVVFPTPVRTPNRTLPIALASIALATLAAALAIRARRAH